MGNTPSSYPPRRLDEALALALATTWRAQLRRFVRLSTNEAYSQPPIAFFDAQRSIYRHFEWIEFGLPGSAGDLELNVEEPAAAARVSTIVWQAIANCPGYSGRENPVFWKKVFSILWSGGNEPTILPDVAFFQDDQRPFPCVRIRPRLGQEEWTLRGFFGPASFDREMRHVLKTLEPYIGNREWWLRPVPLEIVGIDFHVFERVRPYFHVPKRRRPFGLPRFQLVALRMKKNMFGLSEAGVKTLAATSDVSLYVGYCYLDEKTKQTLSMLLAQATWRTNERLQIETLRPRISAVGDDPGFVAICSALPRATMITCLELKGDYGAIELDDVRAAWLGYALFHPDAPNYSSLTALELGLPHVRSNVIDMLKIMAIGNNLLVAIGLSQTMSTAYHEALLAAPTTIYAEDNDKSTVILTLEENARFTLCVPTLERFRGEDWMRVVVPGVGLGWVQFNRILDVNSRAPGRLSLCRLDLYEHRHTEGHLQTVVTDVLSLLGRRLTHLKIHVPLPPDVVQSVLRECPNLLALRVHSNGECWSEQAIIPLTPSIPRLQTLELLISAPFKPLRASQLNDLTCLRVIDQDPDRDSFAIHRDALVATLQRYPRLSHVYWSSKRLFPSPWWEHHGYLPWRAPSGTRFHDWQVSSYGHLGEETRGVLDVAQISLPLRAKLAFLSISDRKMPLSSDIIRLIFTFSARVIPRQILIKYNPDDPWE